MTFKKIKQDKNKTLNSDCIELNNDNNPINNNIVINNKMSKRNKSLSKTNIVLNENTKLEDNTVIDKVNEILKYNDEELNLLPYDLALQFDHRTYWVYYFSLVKIKHSFVSSFFYSNDYNSRIIKISFFFIGFTIGYTVNALFYNDGTMHNIYVNQGSFDLEYKLPKIIYSSLISMVLNMLLKKLALSNNGILDFKKNKEAKNINKKGKDLKGKLKIKFALYFIFSGIFLLFFWYYLSMFGAVYRNTQSHLLNDTLFSFGLSLIYPLGIYLLPGLFRIPALKVPEGKKECLYKFSKILQIF